MMLFALLCCFVVVASDCNKLDELEAELTLMKQSISELQEENSELKQAVSMQKESIEDLNNAILNISKEQQLATDTAFCAFDNSEMLAYNPGEAFTFTVEHLDPGNNYDIETSTYTCPTTGIYMFSSQNLGDGGAHMDFAIVVGGSITAGAHAQSIDSAGDSATVIVITVCIQSQTVQVQAVNEEARRWGKYEDINVSAFSGTLLAQL